MNNFHITASDVAKEVMKSRELAILEQLNPLIEKGILLIEEGEAVFVKDPVLSRITCQVAVRIVLKDKEYIKRLEEKILELEHRLRSIGHAISESGLIDEKIVDPRESLYRPS